MLTNMLSGNNAKIAPFDESKDASNLVSEKRCIHIFHFNDTYNLEPAYEEEPKG